MLPAVGTACLGVCNSGGNGGGGKIQTTKYFDILKNAYSNIYGQHLSGYKSNIN